MSTDEIREETRKALGASADVSHATQELLDEYKKTAKDVDTSTGHADGTRIAGQWGVYGNHITYDPGSGGKVYWKQNPKGTPNYGCGTSESWSAGKSWASHINYKGTCPGGVPWYFIGNYNG